MRPASEVRLALIQAAHDLIKEIQLPRRGPTLEEMARKAGVGRDAARVYVSNCRRAKARDRALDIVGWRRVEYRNRPVAEYAPRSLQSMDGDHVSAGPAVLSQCMDNWTR